MRYAKIKKELGMKNKRLLLLIIPISLMLTILLPLAAFFAGYEVTRDVCYSDGELCTMDIYTPRGR
jgi:hypothetical protein